MTKSRLTTWALWLRSGLAIFWASRCGWCVLTPSSSGCPVSNGPAGVEAPNQFADGFPVLVTSEASVDDLNSRLRAASLEPVGVERFRAQCGVGRC